jgi:glycosyltransferase involved in cell wall biosynthesis
VLALPPARAIRPAARPTFSVVIAAYQAADTVGEAVASALAQTFPAYEVIVVDDGSTDDLSRALSPFGESIRLIRKENGGSASARNAGLEAASGDFFAMLDADDVYGPRRLEVLAELAAARPDTDILTTDAALVVDQREVGRLHAHAPFVAAEQRTAILRTCFVGASPAVRSSRLREIGGFDETLRIAYDWDCWLRLILDGSVGALVDEPHLEYRQHPGSLTTERVGALWERVRLLEKAQHHASLSPEERRVLYESLRHHRTRAVLAEAESALRNGTASLATLLRHAGRSGISSQARALLTLAAAAPSLGRRRLPRDPGPLEQRFAAGAG